MAESWQRITLTLPYPGPDWEGETIWLYSYAITSNPQPNLFVSTDAEDTWQELADTDTWASRGASIWPSCRRT